ncbi:hypothetical protein QUF61_12540 [Candidatus Venteria ishoeyi]|uniref:hypothetical protein n=1 Tax=Candidatus Venteria ishoeyi TaxID=1899563 RepID=UPI0025A5D117|nr:hypothetical protein [Candidatus Venteria ishoeyi]MDM8547317.1 hypothetical protein [Candidatus Venteria ishoeyi]
MKVKYCSKPFLLVALWVFCPIPVNAACTVATGDQTLPTLAAEHIFNIGVYSTDLQAQNYSYTVGFNKLDNAIDAFKSGQIEQNFREKTDFDNFDKAHSPASLRVDFRGLNMWADFAANSSILNLKVHSADGQKTIVDEQFGHVGKNREQAVDELEDYLKKNADALLHELAAASKYDPIAGNPNSLANRQIDNDAAIAFDYLGLRSLVAPATFNFMFGSDEPSDCIDVKSFSIPFLGYSHQMNSGDSINFRLPLHFSRTEGEADAYSAGVGISYSKKVTDKWTVTPGISYGIGGSVDLGAVGQVVSVSLGSNYVFSLTEKGKLSMGNMVAYYQTIPLKLNDVEADYDIKNSVLRNSLMYTHPLGQLSLFGDVILSTYVSDTRVFGDEVAVDQYNEFGILVGKVNKDQQTAWGAGLKYTTDGGFGLSWSYTF